MILSMSVHIFPAHYFFCRLSTGKFIVSAAVKFLLFFLKQYLYWYMQLYTSCMYSLYIHMNDCVSVFLYVRDGGKLKMEMIEGMEGS